MAFAYLTELVMFAFGLVTGVVSGLLGLGGGILVVPALTFLHIEPILAIGTSSLTVIMAATAGTFANFRSGELSPKLILPIAVPAILSGQAGVYLASHVPSQSLLIGFAIFAYANVILMGVKSYLVKTKAEPLSQDSVPLWKAIVVGTAGGLAAGFFGVGGGVIFVPLLIAICHYSIKAAVRTSLAVVLLTSLATFANHYLNGNVLLQVGLVFGLGSAIGAHTGSRLLRIVPDQALQILFKVLMVGVGTYMLLRGLSLI